MLDFCLIFHFLIFFLGQILFGQVQGTRQIVKVSFVEITELMMVRIGFYANENIKQSKQTKRMLNAHSFFLSFFHFEITCIFTKDSERQITIYSFFKRMNATKKKKKEIKAKNQIKLRSIKLCPKQCGIHMLSNRIAILFKNIAKTISLWKKK